MNDKQEQYKHWIGKTIKIQNMQGEPQYTGKSGVVESVDSIGQLHGTWGGLAINPEVDKFGEVKNNRNMGVK